MKQKLYQCKSCGREVIIRSKGMCGVCRNKERPFFNKLSNKKTIDEDLNSFFKKHISYLKQNPYSIEGGCRIREPGRINICHLFDKKRHPSLSCEDRNVIYLTAQEHARFDQLLYSHRFEDLEKDFKDSWEKICLLLKKLLSLCQERTKFYFRVEEYISGKRLY